MVHGHDDILFGVKGNNTMSSKKKYGDVIRSPQWAMGSLAGGGALRLGIPDTILIKDGAPLSWLFTSKSGAVLKKRLLRRSSIKDRFTRLFASNPNNPQKRVATLRLMDGMVRNIDQDFFAQIMEKFPAMDEGIMSIQCYVQSKGASGTVYRNTYRVVNDKGLIVSKTSSFTTLNIHHGAEAPTCSWTDREIKLEKCNAASIKKALDRVTQDVVRYIEAEQDRPTRILHMQCDYVVDDAGRIWLTWIKDTSLAVGEAAQDLRLANVKLEGPRGRGDFLGSQNALAMQQRELAGLPATSEKMKNRRRTGLSAAAGTLSPESYAKYISESIDTAAEITELPRGTVGNGGGGGIADALSRTEAAKKAVYLSSPPRGSSSSLALAGIRDHEEAFKRSQARSLPVLSTMTVGVGAGEAAGEGRNSGHCVDRKSRKRYLRSLACAGDYCSIKVLVRSKHVIHFAMVVDRERLTVEHFCFYKSLATVNRNADALAQRTIDLTLDEPFHAGGPKTSWNIDKDSAAVPELISLPPDNLLDT